MKKGVLIVLLFAVMLLIPMTSAELFLSQPKSTYNMGDDFAFNATIVPTSDANGFFIAKIVCSAGEVEIFRTPLSVKVGVQKIVDVSGRFDNFLTGDLGGTCHLHTEYASYKSDTQDFQIARIIYVNLWTDKVIVNPNDRINISGKGIKVNGELVTKGFIELNIPDLGVTLFKTVDSGQFNIPIDLADNAPAGDHVINARIYEKDGDGIITNEGLGNTSIRINQIIRKSEIAINSQSIDPENQLVYTVLLHDQSDKDVSNNVELSIYKPNGELFLKKMVLSEESNSLNISGNFTPGAWRISSSVDNIQSNRSFYVNEFEKADYKLSEGVLTVTNIGNIPFNKQIEVVIGESNQLQDVNVGIGETKRYTLSAPDGEYSIGIKSDGNEQTLGTSFLTGGVIAVKSESEGGLFSKSYLIIWFLLIAVCGFLAVQQYGRISNKSYYGATPSYSSVSLSPSVKQSSTNVPINLTRAGGAGDIISEGRREECSIISLKVKNNEDIDKAKGDAFSSIERALTRARDARAKIYSDKNYKTIILAPTLTKEKDNSMKAISIASEIENVLNEHNKRFSDKVMFGIGVHNGEMIVESSGNEFKFNSIGSTIPYVKKIADSVSHGTGVSQAVHRRVLGKVKSDKIEGTNYWRIGRVRNNGVHSEFIGKFMERQKRDARR